MGFNSTVPGLIGRKCLEAKKLKLNFFRDVKISDMFCYAIPLLEQNLDYVILHVGSNDAPYKARYFGWNIGINQFH